MQKFRLFSLWLMVALALSAVVPGMAQDAAALNVTEYTLDNGLEVILVEDHSAPTVAVNVLYHVGGANDPVGRGGFAHLFEHMMFEETAHLATGELDRLIETSGGGLNAYTDTERTVYYTALPAHQLPLALWIEADRLASLVVSEENFENQRSVVIEEYQFRVSNAPYGNAIQDLFTLPYGYDPYRRRTIGSVSDLNDATISDVINFHSTYYVPNNATLVVAGDIDVDETRALIDEFFGAIPASDEPPAMPVYEAEERAGERIEMNDPLANVSAILMGYPIPSRTEADFAALEVTARIVGSGASSRLAQALLDTGKAVDVGTFTEGNIREGVFAAYAFANVGVDLAEIEQIYLDELARILDEGVSAEELEKAINQIRSERIVGLETAESLAESVQEANFYFDDPQAVFGEIDRFDDVTNEDVQRVIGQYLTQERSVVLLVEPGEAASTEDPAETTVEADAEATDEAVVDAAPAFIIEQATPPEPLAVHEFILPEITETTLDNGLTVIVIPRPEIPIISVDLFMPGGESAVPADLAGMGDMTAGVLTRGTETRSAQDIASAIEQVGGGIGADVNQDRLSVGVFALREDAELAFEILGDVALNPTFPEEEVEVYRQQMLTNLQDLFANPDALAARTFNRLIYGEHPYGNTVTEATITALSRDAILAYYQQQANPESAFLIVTGAVTEEDALALAESTFGEWQADDDTEPVSLPDVVSEATPGIYLVDRPGSTQAQFAIGLLSFPGGDPERYKSLVMNEILGGGGFSSRLMGVVREELGYTYGISSRFSLPIGQGNFLISSAVGNDVVAPALQAILDQVNLIRDEPVPADELNEIAAGMIGSDALRLETYQSLVNQIAAFRLRGIPASEISEYASRIGAVDQAAVQAAAQTYIVPENLLIVVVGDASAIEAPLAEIAPVTVIEAE
jgi:zinc protease